AVMARTEVYLREWNGSIVPPTPTGPIGAVPLKGVISVAVHGDEVYVTDSRNLLVQVFDRLGGFLRKWPSGTPGTPGNGDGQFAPGPGGFGPVGLSAHGRSFYVAVMARTDV